MAVLPPPVSDLEIALGLDAGTLAGAEALRATRALKDATGLALAEVSEAKATTWRTDAPDVVETVVLQAARRAFENPQGLRQEQLGEHGFSVDVAGIYLTPHEVALIARAARGGRRAGFVGSIRTPSAWDAP